MIQDEKMYEQLRSQLKNIYFDVHAIYEPDGSDSIWGRRYCAAVDLFRQGLTFRLYFSIQDGEIYVEHVERWYFG